MPSIEFGDLVQLNHLLKEKNTRYHLRYKDSRIACIEPPGACCLTPTMTQDAFACIRAYYREKGREVLFSQDGLYFTLEPAFPKDSH